MTEEATGSGWVDKVSRLPNRAKSMRRKSEHFLETIVGSPGTMTVFRWW